MPSTIVFKQPQTILKSFLLPSSLKQYHIHHALSSPTQFCIELANNSSLPIVSTIVTTAMSRASLTPAEVKKEPMCRLYLTTFVPVCRSTPTGVGSSFALSAISTSKYGCSSWFDNMELHNTQNSLEIIQSFSCCEKIREK